MRTLQSMRCLCSKARDFVSSAHPVSNLRLTRFAKRDDETNYERKYRESREALQKWNHLYWQENNTRYHLAKSEYIRKVLCEHKSRGQEKEALTQDELSPFYGRFLDENYLKHINYNKEWYRRHISLVVPAVMAFLAKHRLIRDKTD